VFNPNNNSGGKTIRGNKKAVWEKCSRNNQAHFCPRRSKLKKAKEKESKKGIFLKDPQTGSVGKKLEPFCVEKWGFPT